LGGGLVDSVGGTEVDVLPSGEVVDVLGGLVVVVLPVGAVVEVTGGTVELVVSEVVVDDPVVVVVSAGAVVVVDDSGAVVLVVVVVSSWHEMITSPSTDVARWKWLRTISVSPITTVVVFCLTPKAPSSVPVTVMVGTPPSTVMKFSAWTDSPLMVSTITWQVCPAIVLVSMVSRVRTVGGRVGLGMAKSSKT